MTSANTTPNYALTGSLLVAQFNEMVATATDLGLEGYREVNRFATNQAGVARTKKLHEAIQAAAHPSKDPEVVEAETGVHPLDQGNQDHVADETVNHAILQGNSAPEETTSQGNSAPEEEEADRLPNETEEAYMARKAAKKAAGKKKKAQTGARKATGGARVKSTSGTTIREKTEEYNRLVPAARKAGITWAKHHTSNFESQDKADIAMAKLKKAMKG